MMKLIGKAVGVFRANLDAVVLAGLAVVLLSGWVFVEIADEVIEGEADKWDRLILESLGGRADGWDPIGPAWLEDFWRDITALGSGGVTVLITGAAGVYFVLRGRYGLLYLTVGTYAGAGLLTWVLKLLFGRPRPETMTELARATSGSFPSGHSLVAMVVYLTLGVLLASSDSRLRFKLYYVLLALTVVFLVGVSRAYLGVHYPTDILAGWSLGLVWAVVCWIILYKLNKRAAGSRGAGESA